MTFALGILTFFVVLAALVLVHETGHFTFAKLFGVDVQEFGLGFPPRLKTWRRGGTLYSVNAIPLGGFVRMLGENGEAASPNSFGAKPPWQRLLVLAAGPAMNILLAIAIFFFLFMGALGGSPRGLTVITRITPHSPASAAGLRDGDRIAAVNGTSVRYLDELQSITAAHLGQHIELSVRRGGQTFTTSIVPRVHPPKNQGAMGIELGDTITVRYGPGRALGEAAGQVAQVVTGLPLVVQSVSGNGPPNQHLSGPIGIAHITTRVVQNEPKTGFSQILWLVGILSGSLGVLNLLPIPALDGGRIVFVLISWIRRRNLDPELEGLVHMAGMAILLLLITLVSYQDVARWIGGSF